MARAGLFDHPIATDDLTEDDVLGWENAGVFAAESAKGNGFSRFYLSLRP